jgi:hypothetical protein
MKFFCSSCGQKLELPDDFEKESVFCPICGVTATVPAEIKEKKSADSSGTSNIAKKTTKFNPVKLDEGNLDNQSLDKNELPPDSYKIPYQNKRPKCVTVIGILLIVFGAINVFCIPLLVYSEMSSNEVNRLTTGITVWSMILPIIGLFFGIGLLQLKESSRRRAVKLAAYEIFVLVLQLLISYAMLIKESKGLNKTEEAFFVAVFSLGVILSVANIAFCITVRIYLSKAKTRKAFVKRESIVSSNGTLLNGFYQDHFDVSGGISTEGFIRNGFHEGFWTYYYENGQIKKRGNYEEGLAEGEWEFYDWGDDKKTVLMYKYGSEV